jgi:hypothetical protein
MPLGNIPQFLRLRRLPRPSAVAKAYLVVAGEPVPRRGVVQVRAQQRARLGVLKFSCGIGYLSTGG